MFFSSALISAFLLAPAVLATGHRRHAGRVRKSGSLQVNTDDNWAGALLTSSNVSSVSGVFNVPHVTGPVGSGVSVVVMIDGSTCQNAMYQTGITAQIGDSGVSIWAWGTSWPNYSEQYSLTISPGDQLRLSVTATPDGGGMSYVENLTTGDSGSRPLATNMEHCLVDAVWIVSDPTVLDGGYLEPLASFGSVVISEIQAVDSQGTQTLDQGHVIVFDMVQSGTWMASTWVADTSVSVTRM